MGRDKALGAAIPRETFDYFADRGFPWNHWMEAFLARDWRAVQRAEGGRTAYGRWNLRCCSPPFPSPITAFVYAETCDWTPQENTL